MSAYLVSRDHVCFLLDAMAALNYPGEKFSYLHNGRRSYVDHHNDTQMAEVGALLWAENGKSLDARYGDDESPRFGAFEGLRLLSVDPVQAIKAAHCLAYQSCEHDGWAESQANAILDGIISAAVHRLPGYDGAEWGPPKDYDKAAPHISLLSMARQVAPDMAPPTNPDDCPF